MFLTKIAKVSLAFGIVIAMVNTASATLIAYYALDETTTSIGATVADTSGASLNRNAKVETDASGTGPLVGQPPANGGSGFSYTFDSQATNKNYFDTPSLSNTAANAFFQRDTPFTYAVWLMPTADQFANPTVIGITGNGFDFQLAPASGTNWALKLAGFNAPTPTLTSSIATIPSDVWSHVAITKGDTSSGTGAVNFYVNGTLVESGTIGRPAGTPSSGRVLRLFFAASGISGGYYQGGMDELSLYNEELDATTIAGLAGVPEPTAFVLAVLGLVGFASRPRRRM